MMKCSIEECNRQVKPPQRRFCCAAHRKLFWERHSRAVNRAAYNLKKRKRYHRPDINKKHRALVKRRYDKNRAKILRRAKQDRIIARRWREGKLLDLSPIRGDE